MNYYFHLLIYISFDNMQITFEYFEIGPSLNKGQGVHYFWCLGSKGYIFMFLIHPLIFLIRNDHKNLKKLLSKVKMNSIPKFR
jgi:hypothetical protein